MTTSHFFCVTHHSTFVCFSSGHLFINSIFRFFLSFIRFRAHSGATLFFCTINSVKQSNQAYCNNEINERQQHGKYNPIHLLLLMHWNSIKLSLFCCFFFRTFFFYFTLHVFTRCMCTLTSERAKKIIHQKKWNFPTQHSSLFVSNTEIKLFFVLVFDIDVRNKCEINLLPLKILARKK